MSLFDVLALATRLGVLLTAAPDGERIKPLPAANVTEELRAGIRAHKAELLALLKEGRAPPAPPAAHAAKRALRSPNTTPTPDVLFDELAPALREGELRVLLYLIRRTYGFRKAGDRISLSQFERGLTTKEGRQLDQGTGMTRQGVILALASLEDRGYVVCERSNAGSRGHGTNLYTLHILHEDATEGDAVT